MLELATGHDREAVNALAAQVHAMHAGWRPDIYEAVEELYPQERFLTAIRDRQLYVAKISGIVVGYTAVKIHNFDWPGVVKRKVMFIDEFGDCFLSLLTTFPHLYYSLRQQDYSTKIWLQFYINCMTHLI